MSETTRLPVTEPAPRPRSRRLVLFVPLIAFAGLAALFLVQLFAGPPSRLPSALIGQQVPAFTLPGVQGLPIAGLTDADLRQGRVSVVNVWASWCLPCRDEHPLLMDLSRDPGFDLVGINNKDQADNARRFLGQLGNPYRRIGADQNGRVSIDFGVYGVPETFVVDGAGRITWKYVGPLTPQIVRDQLLPQIRLAQNGTAPAQTGATR